MFAHDLLMLRASGLLRNSGTAIQLLREVHSGGCITFDDGLREGFSQVAGQLAAHNLGAILFVCPAFLRNDDLMYRHKASLLVEIMRGPDIAASTKLNVYDMLGERGIAGTDVRERILNVPYRQRDVLDSIADMLGFDVPSFTRKNRPYLEADELRRLSRGGMLIGSHGMDHSPFNRDTPDQYIDHLRESFDALDAIAAQPLRLFSYPFGDHGVPHSMIGKVIRECDLAYSFGTAGWRPEQHPRHVQRLRMETSQRIEHILLQEVVRKIARRMSGRSVARH